MPKFSLSSWPSDLCHFHCHAWWSCSNYWHSHQLLNYEQIIFYVEDGPIHENQPQRACYLWDSCFVAPQIRGLVVSDPWKAPWHHSRWECQSWTALLPLVLPQENWNAWDTLQRCIPEISAHWDPASDERTRIYISVLSSVLIIWAYFWSLNFSSLKWTPMWPVHR